MIQDFRDLGGSMGDLGPGCHHGSPRARAAPAAPALLPPAVSALAPGPSWAAVTRAPVAEAFP